MNEVRLSSVIRASPEAVFAILTDPDQYRKINSTNVLVTYDRIERLPDGGFEMLWSYSALGFPVRLRTYTTELAPARLFTVRTEGQIEAQMTINLAEATEGTQVELHIEFIMGQGILRFISAPFVANQMGYSMEMLLANLKRMAEHADAG